MDVRSKLKGIQKKYLILHKIIIHIIKNLQNSRNLEKIILENLFSYYTKNIELTASLYSTTQNLFSYLNESVGILLRINKFQRLMKTPTLFLVSFDLVSMKSH